MRYLINFSYDGSLFSGYQKQLNKRTIQGNIESVLKNRFNKDVHIYSTGRTDKGVHAINAYAHFDAEKCDLEKLTYYLNKKTDDDIYIKSIKVVNDSFHARFNIKSKTYKYVINIGSYDLFRRNYEYQYNKDLNIDKMKELIPLFIGEHNFENFTTIQDKKESYNRTIYNIDIVKDNNLVNIYIKGNGFLRFMVRNIVGCMLSYENDRLTINEIKDMINNKTNNKPIKSSACGLYLFDVEY